MTRLSQAKRAVNAGMLEFGATQTGRGGALPRKSSMSATIFLPGTAASRR